MSKSKKQGRYADMRRFAVLLRIKADTIARDYVDGFNMLTGKEYGKLYSTCTITNEEIKWIESIDDTTMFNAAKEHRKKTQARSAECKKRKAEEALRSEESGHVPSFEEQYAQMLAEVEAYENEQSLKEV